MAKKLPSIAIVTCHFNPCGYTRPIENLAKVKAHMEALGVPLVVAECSFVPYDGFKASPAVDNKFISASVLWQKEALLNAAVTSLPANITKVIVMDADVLIPSAEWVQQVEDALENHNVVQPWSRCSFLDESDEEVSVMASMAYAASIGDPRRNDFSVYHPGFIWAFKRTFFTSGPGLFELCPVGIGDVLLANAMVSNIPNRIDAANPMLARDMRAWEQHLSAWNEGKPLGCAEADIKTLWHGTNENRKYSSRVQILADYDPYTDVYIAENGLVEWMDLAREKKGDMIRAVAGYFSARLEDGDTWEKQPEVIHRVNPPDQPNLYYSEPEPEQEAESLEIPYEL